MGQVTGKNKRIGTSKISPLLKTWIPLGSLDPHPQVSCLDLEFMNEQVEGRWKGRAVSWVGTLPEK